MKYFSKTTNPANGRVYGRDRGRIRTCDRLLRRQMLYPAELRDRFIFNKKCFIL